MLKVREEILKLCKNVRYLGYFVSLEMFLIAVLLIFFSAVPMMFKYGIVFFHIGILVTALTFSNCKKDEISEKNLFYLLLSKEQFVRGIIFWWGMVPVAIYITNIGYSFSSRIIIYIVLLAIRSILTRAIARKFKKIVIGEKN